MPGLSVCRGVNVLWKLITGIENHAAVKDGEAVDRKNTLSKVILPVSEHSECVALFIGLYCLNIGNPRLGSIGLRLRQIQ